MIVVTYKGLVEKPKKQANEFSIKQIKSNEDCLGTNVIAILVVEETDSEELIRDVNARIYSRLAAHQGDNVFIENYKR